MTGSPAPTHLIDLPGTPARRASPPGAPPGLPPDGPPFHSALESEWARTASAEGHHHDSASGASAGAPRHEHTDHGEGEREGGQLIPPVASGTPDPAASAPAGAPNGGVHATGGATGAPSTGAPDPIGNRPDTGLSGGAEASSSHDAAEGARAAGAPDVGATTNPAGAAGGENVETSTGATGGASGVSGSDGVAAGAGSPASAPAAGSASAGDALALADSHASQATPTPSSTPAGAQPTAAAAGTPNPSPSPLTPTAVQAASGAAGNAAETAQGATAPGTAPGSTPATLHAAAAGVHSAPLGIQRSEGSTGKGSAGEGQTGEGSTGESSTGESSTGERSTGAGPTGEGSTGDTATHGEHRGPAHPDTAGAPSSVGAGNSIHDTLRVPDSALQTPTEASALGTTTGAPAEALGLEAGYAGAAGDLGALADLGALDLGGGLAQAVETLHATIELAARQGVSQARIALHPAELGAIRIHLSQTAAGLIARVTADTPAAAQALASGHAELRQSLGQLGLGSVRLHIAHGGPAPQGEGGTGAGGREAGRRAGARAGEVRLARSLAGAGRAIAAAVPAADSQAEPPTPTQSGRALDVLV